MTQLPWKLCVAGLFVCACNTQSAAEAAAIDPLPALASADKQRATAILAEQNDWVTSMEVLALLERGRLPSGLIWAFEHAGDVPIDQRADLLIKPVTESPPLRSALALVCPDVEQVVTQMDEEPEPTRGMAMWRGCGLDRSQSWFEQAEIAGSAPGATMTALAMLAYLDQRGDVDPIEVELAKLMLLPLSVLDEPDR